MKRVLLYALAVMVFVGVLSGCASFLDDTYVSMHTHNASDSSSGSSAAMVISTYEEMTAAILKMVENYSVYGVLRVYTYDGDVESAVKEACMEVSNDTAVGAYSVYYMDSDVNKIVSYYEAQITITYKRSADDMKSIEDVSGTYTLNNVLKRSMQEYEASVAVRTSSPDITAEFVTEAVRSIYYDDPSCSVLMPEITVTEYPKGENDRIIEVTFAYQYLNSKLTSMSSELSEAVGSATATISSTDDLTTLHELCAMLSELCDYETEPTSPLSVTAYGALVKGKATDEGFAMAFKLLCDKMKVECTVVQGRFNSVDHVWNIVELDGICYHIDVSRYLEAGADVFMKNDAEMSGTYWWDTELYPACSGTPAPQS